MNLNRVIIAGRLTADPQLRSTTSGQSVATFGLATSRTWTDKKNEKQEQTEFHNVVAWGRTGELVAQYLKKGSLALIEGRLQTRDWEDKDKNKRKTTEVIAESVQFGPRPQGDAPRSTAASAEPIINLDEDEAMASEIPF